MTFVSDAMIFTLVKLIRKVNWANIIIITKVETWAKIANYHPFNLIYSLLKVNFKILASKLGKISLVDPSQLALIHSWEMYLW